MLNTEYLSVIKLENISYRIKALYIQKSTLWSNCIQPSSVSLTNKVHQTAIPKNL